MALDMIPFSLVGETGKSSAELTLEEKIANPTVP